MGSKIFICHVATTNFLKGVFLVKQSGNPLSHRLPALFGMLVFLIISAWHLPSSILAASGDSQTTNSEALQKQRQTLEEELDRLTKRLEAVRQELNSLGHIPEIDTISGIPTNPCTTQRRRGSHLIRNQHRQHPHPKIA